jgi:hypothetical protein
MAHTEGWAEMAVTAKEISCFSKKSFQTFSKQAFDVYFMVMACPHLKQLGWN